MSHSPPAATGHTARREALSPPATLLDRHDRPLRDLRLSVTDQCNFRCSYCMPLERFGPGHRFLPRRALLSFPELDRLTRVAASLGVRKVRLTGGEPLLRPRLEELVERLAVISGVADLALTTNGSLLATKASALRRAGLGRITVSLDSLEAPVFERLSGRRGALKSVLAGLEAAAAAGFRALRINAVIRRGHNEGAVIALARHFRKTGCVVRFIEYMDVGGTSGWSRSQVVTADEMLAQLETLGPLVPLSSNTPGEVAERYAFADGSLEVGLIASVTRPFCRSCVRLRLTAEGMAYPCLFASQGLNLGADLRAGASDDQLALALRSFWTHRQDRYSEQRDELVQLRPKIFMSTLGG